MGCPWVCRTDLDMFTVRHPVGIGAITEASKLAAIKAVSIRAKTEQDKQESARLEFAD